MSHPALQAQIDVFPMSIDAIDRIVQALPAKDRAALLWAPQVVRGHIERLYVDDLRREDARRVSQDIYSSLARPLHVILPYWVSRPDFRHEADRLLVDCASRLNGILQSPAARDQADFAFRVLRGVARFSTTQIEAGHVLENLDDAVLILEKLVVDDFGGALLRAEALFVALLEGAEQGKDPKQAAVLASYAFLEAERGLSALGGAGIRIAIYEGESAEERRERTLRAVAEVREVGSDDLARAIEDARMERWK